MTALISKNELLLAHFFKNSFSKLVNKWFTSILRTVVSFKFKILTHTVLLFHFKFDCPHPKITLPTPQSANKI